MAESDDVGAVLPESGGERKLFGMPCQRNKPNLAVGMVTHEDGQLATWGKNGCTIGNERAVAVKECRKRRCPRQVARVSSVKFLPPIWRVRPNELKLRHIPEVAGVGSIETAVDVP